MKNITKLLALMLSLLAITCFSLACAPSTSDNGGEGQTPPQHTHEYSTEYKYDETNHWFECECGEKTEVNEHIFNSANCACGKYEPTYYTEGLTFELNEDSESYRVAKYSGKGKKVVIPAVYDGLPVTRIGNQAFWYANVISVIIGDNVTDIESQGFGNCSLKTVKFPSGLKTIGEEAFVYSGLTSVELPEGLISIGFCAFGLSMLSSEVEIPESVTEIGDGAFACPYIKSFIVDSANENYKSINGNLYSKNGKTLVEYAADKKSVEFRIPSHVENISPLAFFGCLSLSQITIPKTVKSIDSYAFYHCISLESVVIPNSVTSIGEYAFAECFSLERVVIPNSVTSIGRKAFAVCYLLTVYCEADNKPSGWVDDWRFDYYHENICVVWDCNNNDVADNGNIYAKIDGIRYALKDESATVIYQQEFMSGFQLKGITNVEIPSNVIYKGKTYSVTRIEYAYRNCTTLISVVIPDSVKDIGEWAFYGCTSLTSVVIGDSVTSIGAFYGCDNLTSAIFKNTKGWIVSGRGFVSSSDMADPKKAAEFLRSSSLERFVVE